MKTLQKLVKRFNKKYQLSSTIEIRMLDIVSEVGELAKEVLKGTSYGKKEHSPTDSLEEEFGDVFYSLICAANETGVDLEKALDKSLDKYQKRFDKKGNIGSC